MTINALSLKSDVSEASIERPKMQDPLQNRIKRAIARALLILIYIVAFPVTIAAVSFRLYSYLSTKNMIEAFAEKRYQAAQDAVKDITLPSQGEDTELGKATHLLANFIKMSPPKGAIHDHMQKLREKINDVLLLPSYESNKEKSDPYIDFLHKLAHTLTAQAEGMDVFENYGKEAIEGYSDCQPSYEKLATVLDRAVKEHRHFEKDTKIGKLFWLFAHPEKGFNSLFDHLGWTDPLSYNSYRQGNANIRVGAFNIGDTKMHLSLGPTPTADRLFEAHLQYLKHRGQGQVHFQQDLEFSGTPGERDRRLEKKRMAERNPDEMVYMATPLDGMIWKGRGAFEKIGSTKDFFIQLKEYMNGYREMPQDPKLDNSFYIPEKVVKKDEDLQTLLNVTEQMFSNCPEMDRRRLNRAQLLGFEAMLAVQAMISSTKDKGSIDCYMGQACKQDIDRGVILNVMTMLYFDALGGVSLTEQRIQQIVGITLARCGMVDDRAILQNRYSALSDLLHIISCDPEKYFAPMKAHFSIKNAAFETVIVE